MHLNADQIQSPYTDPAVTEKLKTLAAKYFKQSKKYDKNLAHVCSFWEKGECNRGQGCPYRHYYTKEELSRTKEEHKSAEASIQERYSGMNDPLAKKLLNRIQEDRPPAPPSDSAITTLFLGGVTPKLDFREVKEYFENYGKVEHIKLKGEDGVGFVRFSTREEATNAIADTYKQCQIFGNSV